MGDFLDEVVLHESQLRCWQLDLDFGAIGSLSDNLVHLLAPSLLVHQRLLDIASGPRHDEALLRAQSEVAFRAICRNTLESRPTLRCKTGLTLRCHIYGLFAFKLIVLMLVLQVQNVCYRDSLTHWLILPIFFRHVGKRLRFKSLHSDAILLIETRYDQHALFERYQIHWQITVKRVSANQLKGHHRLVMRQDEP